MTRHGNCAAIDLLIAQAQQQLELTEGEASLDATGRDTRRHAAVRAVRRRASSAIGRRPRPPSPRATQTPLPQLRAFQWLHSFSGLTRYAAAAVVDRRQRATDETVPEEPAADADRSRRGQPPARACIRCAARASATPCIKCSNWPQPGPVWPGQRQLLQRAARRAGGQAQRRDAVGRSAGTGRPDDRPRAPGRSRRRPAPGRHRAPSSASSNSNSSFRCSRCRWRGCASCAPRMASADVVPASLDATTLNGMLTGFADLIIEWDGRFHVLDYKTNWLGARLHDYRGNVARRRDGRASLPAAGAALHRRAASLSAPATWTAIRPNAIWATAGICSSARSAWHRVSASGAIAGRPP